MAGAVGIGWRGVEERERERADDGGGGEEERVIDGGGEGGEADAVLVARARADRLAFAPLYRRYVDRIYRYCYRRLGTREAAEDATAAVFAKALAALPRYRDGSFRSWLFAIAHNTIASEFRRRAARPEGAPAGTDAALLADPAPSPEDAALAAEARASVLGLLPRLPEEQRRVLELRLAGLSGPEIAHVLGRSPGSVRVAQFRAIGRLRGWLAEAAGGANVATQLETSAAATPQRGADNPASGRDGPTPGASRHRRASPSSSSASPRPTPQGVAGIEDGGDPPGAEWGTTGVTGATERSQRRTAGGRDG